MELIQQPTFNLLFYTKRYLILSHQKISLPHHLGKTVEQNTIVSYQNQTPDFSLTSKFKFNSKC
jgi:hypothetical protein